MKRILVCAALCALVGFSHAAATNAELVAYSYDEAKAVKDRNDGKLLWSDYFRSVAMAIARVKTERTDAHIERYRMLIEVAEAMEAGAITPERFKQLEAQINAEANAREQQYWAAKNAQADRDRMRKFGEALSGWAAANEESTRRQQEAARHNQPKSVTCTTTPVLGTLQTVCR